MSILFIHGSPNKQGNTSKLAEKLMDGKAYQTLSLVDYKVYGYGQQFPADNENITPSRSDAATKCAFL